MKKKEIWIAKEKKGQGDQESIIFEILDHATRALIRTEEKRTITLPLMFALGGYPPDSSIEILKQPLPWRFTKDVNGQIYLKDESNAELFSPAWKKS